MGILVQDKKNKKGNIILEELYRPSPKEVEVIAEVYQKFHKWKNAVFGRTWEQLEGKTVKNYIKIARERFNGIVPENPLINRPKYFSKEFRFAAEKVLLYVANLVQNPKFTGVEGLDVQLATLLNAILKIIRKGSKWKILDAAHFLMSVVDGTSIVYVSYKPKIKKVKNIDYYDWETGEIKFEEKDLFEDEIEEMWVDPLDFFVPKPYEPDIQKQGEVIWRKFMTWNDFKRMYSGFPQAKFVYPGTYLAEESLMARMIDSATLGSDKIEILQYFNSEEDQYIVIANGVWLNPVGKNKDIMPLLWNHKKLPFAKTIYRFTSPPIFWGASLIHLAKDEIDAWNNLVEMALARIYKAINPPIYTTDVTVPSDTKIEGGKLYVVRGDLKEVQMIPLDPNVWNMSFSLQNQIYKAVTPMEFPSPPSRQPRSASEILARQQKELQAYQTQKVFYQDLMEQKIWLEIQNALQFLTAQTIRKMTGEQTWKSILRVEDIQTPSGLTNLEIRIKEKPEELSTPEELKMESLLRSLSKKERLEIIEVTSETLKNLKFDVELTFDLENTPELRKVNYMNFANFLVQMFGGLIDHKKALIRLFEVWNENPADWLPDDVLVSLYAPETSTPTRPMIHPAGLQEQTMPEQIIQATQRGPEAGVKGGRPPAVSPNLTDLLTLGENV